MSKKIETNWDELWPIINVLNEVRFGINLDPHKENIVNYAGIPKLIEKLAAHELLEENSKKTFGLDFNKIEILMIISCFDAVLNKIEEWEFHSRIGIYTSDALMIKEKFSSEIFL